ncbi:MAG TPA: hypothetical protein VFQ25_05065 [Ktedonobacterales bacterium]|nr:hypothetical protein [Ktedonobacterales bacterium]
MTYSHGPREGAPRTIRLEDQPLPDRESAFHTPRAGDWLLLAVLVVALVGIGGRVWSQLGFGDPVGRAIFFGLLLLAGFWFALVYTFKLSLSMRVGPQGLAIVRGPWRIELRWSEITRLMERPQTAGGRRYRWVVALARDGRRIQVREDALLDYERFRREVYQRYRMWRDHGGTWGATGSGPFTAREMATDEARWWAVAALLIALPGFYLALLLPATYPAGPALLALALVCLAMIAGVYLRRRSYAIDGRMIQARGMLERTQLAWRDVSKVERTRHPASGAILAAVAVGRLALRLAARGDAGVRGFAWAPRVPEYLTLRGGGRQARIRLHRLSQPEELLAWIEFYTGLRRSGSSHPVEQAAQTDAIRPSGAPETAPAAAAATVVVDERAPDLSSASGPLDPWGGTRRGEPTGGPARATSSPSRTPMPEPLFRGAPLRASFREPDGLDQPPAAADGSGGNEEAWLRETSALLSMGGGSPASETPRAADPVADAHTIATPTPPPPAAAPRSRQFAPRPFAPRSNQRPRPPRATPPPFTPQATPATAGPFAPPPITPRAAQQPRQPSPFEPYNPDMPDMPDMPEEPRTPERRAPEATPVAASWSEPARTPMSGALDDLDGFDMGDETGEAEAGVDEAWEEQPAPWRQADWQPPVLPRFGPPGDGGAPQSSRPDDRRTDR